ncbi:MAG TPA: hypothetical protein VKP89_18525 [Burkholderiales bacterium]|nr:hypothetical protein [Burkholderiales bacterium]
MSLQESAAGDAPKLKRRLQLASGLILVLGLCAAVLIYRAADAGADEAVAYEIINGQAYSVAPTDSKLYNRELERIGGKAALLFADFARWFAGLWRGKSLAFTVAFLTATASAGLFLIARRC